mgnify:CR=1 FL=1
MREYRKTRIDSILLGKTRIGLHGRIVRPIKKTDAVLFAYNMWKPRLNLFKPFNSQPCGIISKMI